MATCAGCAFSAGTVTAMYVIGRLISLGANFMRARAMARVAREHDAALAKGAEPQGNIGQLPPGSGGMQAFEQPGIPQG